jgi:hypothetical protein
MPAIAGEVEEALGEGVRIDVLAAPVRAERRDGSLAITARRMQLGPPDDSGRRQPLPVADSEFALSADTLIAAVAREPDWKGLVGEGRLRLDDGRADGIWAGGDMLDPGIAAAAVGQGRPAAETVPPAPSRSGEPTSDERRQAGTDDVLLGFYPQAPRERPRRLSPAESLSRPAAEVAGFGLSEDRLLREGAAASPAASASAAGSAGCTARRSASRRSSIPGPGHTSPSRSTAAGSAASASTSAPAGSSRSRPGREGRIAWLSVSARRFCVKDFAGADRRNARRDHRRGARPRLPRP